MEAWVILSCVHLSLQQPKWFNFLATYDEDGAVNFLDVFNASIDAYTELTVAAGTALRQFYMLEL